MTARGGWRRYGTGLTVEERREMARGFLAEYESRQRANEAEAARRASLHPTEMARGFLAEYESRQRADEAEAARRASLHPTERLAEDGAKLRQEIESNDDMIAVLEVSRSTRAGCRAYDCFYAPAIDIKDEFRIRVEGIRELGHYRTKYYYHIICFEAMMEVEDMIPSGKFVCDGGDEAWGLIVRKWFQHRGQIDHEVLVQYIKDREDWEMKHSGGMPPAVRRALVAAAWQRDADDGTEAIASSSASGPDETTGTSGKEDDSPPVLQDYVTDDLWVSLSVLLRLPEIWAGRMQLMQHPGQPFMWQAIEPWPDVHEGLELQEYGPKTEEQVNMEIEKHQERLDEKRHLLRMGWDKWHAPASEVPVSSGLDDDDAELAEGVVEGRKRSRSHPADGEESGDKRRKFQGDDDTEGKT